MTWEFAKLTWKIEPEFQSKISKNLGGSKINIKNSSQDVYESVFSEQELTKNVVNYFEVKFETFTKKRNHSNIIIGVIVNPSDSDKQGAFSSHVNGFGLNLKYNALRRGSNF